MSSYTGYYFSLAALVLTFFFGFSNHVVIGVTTRDDNAIVTIPQGTLQGKIMLTRNNRSISAFQGIPYGQPPIGNLRFRSPILAGAWSGTLNATVEGQPCPQSAGSVGEEDCLYLNVYTPQLPESDEAALLPVMVFIPGGGFTTGNGNSDLYGPAHLLDVDVILVSLNYCLGPLGFLSTGDEVAPGNWGLKDQVLALQWVQDNIAYFGGNPDQVTIFGQSAGGASVQLLTLSESTIGLFHKFISESGAAYGFLTHRPRATYVNNALQLGETLGCPTDTSLLLVDCLRELNVTALLSISLSWGPTDEPDIEGAFLTDAPANLFEAGKVRDVPSITGIVKDDGIGSVPGRLPDSEEFQEFLDNFDKRLPTVLQYLNRVDDVERFTATLKEFYFNNDLTVNRTQVWSRVGELATDALFTYPAYQALQKQLAFAESPAFFYFFEYRGVFSYGDQISYRNEWLNDKVVHCDELIYLFPQTETVAGAPPEEMSDIDLVMIDTMVQLWTSFATNGTPTTTATMSNTTWLPYSSEDNYLSIGSGSDPRLELRYNFLPERMELWNRLTATGSGNVVAISPCLKLICILLIACPKIRSSIKVSKHF